MQGLVSIKTLTSKHVSCGLCAVKNLCMGKNLTLLEFNDLDRLIKNIKTVAKKNLIYQMNDPVTHFYAIYRGSSKEYWTDENGNECITNFYFPGDIIGVESLAKQKYMFDMIALENIELCVIPVDELFVTMQQSTKIMKRFLTITTQKMQHDQSSGRGITASEKVADFLLNIAMRMTERNSEQKEIYLPMSQIDISNFLGITAETINRIFNVLKEREIIKLKNKKFEIINLLELKKLGKFDYS